MLRCLKERFIDEPQREPNFFQLNEKVKIEWLGDHENILFETGNNDQNLEDARKSGIEPISFAEILDFIGEESIENSVLIDYPGRSSIVNGVNRFRLIEDNPEAGEVTIQYCGRFGQYDGKFKPVTIDRNSEIFTGLTHQSYADGGEPLSLSEVVGMVTEERVFGGGYPNNVRWFGEHLFLAKKVDGVKQLIQQE